MNKYKLKKFKKQIYNHFPDVEDIIFIGMLDEYTYLFQLYFKNGLRELNSVEQAHSSDDELILRKWMNVDVLQLREF